MREDCTIVLITHSRPRYLQRALRWYGTMDFPVIVADSGTAPTSSVEPSGDAVRVIYRRGGLDVYLLKILAALADVRTPYVAMCDDDDFLLPEGLSRAIEFLGSRPDYAFAQGYTYQFQPIGQRLVVWPIPYRHDNEADAWIDRVEQSVAHPVNYGVNRTEILRAAVNFLTLQDFSETLVGGSTFNDLGLSTYVARCGKWKRVPVPSHMREYGGAALSEGGRLASIVSRNVPDFYRNLSGFLMDGDTSESNRNRLQRIFTQHYADILAYDLETHQSKKRFVGFLPRLVLRTMEYGYRQIEAARAYLTRGSIPLLKIYRMPVYRRFREFALLPGDRERD